jgi:hypothetical protein
VQRIRDGDLALSDRRNRPAFVVPAMRIYTPTDSVAPWPACLDTVRETAEHIEVLGSHVGMAINLLPVHDRLGQPEGDWRPFGAPAGPRARYLRPVSWRDRPLPSA